MQGLTRLDRELGDSQLVVGELASPGSGFGS
jgi:hypothetical protein